MRVLKAKHAGACYGVQRALDMAKGTAGCGKPTYTLGPLIHNPQVVEQLSRQGIVSVSSVDEAEPDSVVIIRSHGVTPQVKETILQAGHRAVDATCPHVARAQKAAAELGEAGMRVLVVGEAGHPEVEGLVAHAKASGTSVSVVLDASGIPDDIEAPVGVVVQTTQTKAALDGVVAALADRGIDATVKNTICFATQQRQEAAASLATSVDAMVVIGGKNSSNTTRLAEICAAQCSHAYHVERSDELDPKWFEGCSVVGVTAGASTPESQIDAVVSRLSEM